MGYDFEVYSYLPIPGTAEYDYKLVYAGASFLDATNTMYREKEKGIGCVKLVWRGGNPFAKN